MHYTATSAARTDDDFVHHVYILASPDGAEIEVWPALGCNTVRWQVPGKAGPRDILFAPPAAMLFDRPTRGGVPILFPFPNRIRGGRFSLYGTEYSFPAKDPAQANAITGYHPRCARQLLDLRVDAAEHR